MIAHPMNRSPLLLGLLLLLCNCTARIEPSRDAGVIEPDAPGPAASTGTYGRLRDSPGHRVLIGVSSTEKNVFLDKPPSSAP